MIIKGKFRCKHEAIIDKILVYSLIRIRYKARAPRKNSLENGENYDSSLWPWHPYLVLHAFIIVTATSICWNALFKVFVEEETLIVTLADFLSGRAEFRGVGFATRV